MNKIIINDFAPGADRNVTVPAAGSSPYQSCGNLLNVELRDKIINYATLENRGFNLLDEKLILAEEGDYLGYISSEISTASKYLTPAVDIVLDLANGLYSAPGITLHFWQNYCTEVNISWYRDAELISSETFYPAPKPNESNPNLLTSYFEYEVEYFNKVVLRFIKTENPYQFVKLAGVDLGRTREITDFHSNISIFAEIDPDCADLPASTCDFMAVVKDFKPKGMQEIYVHGGKEEKLFGKFIIDRVCSEGYKRYSFECSDEIIKMENSTVVPKEQKCWPVPALVLTLEESSNITMNIDAALTAELNGFFESNKSAREFAAMISFGSGYIISGFGRNMLTFKKLRNRRDKVISSSQILGKAKYTPVIPYTDILLVKYVDSFDTVQASLSAQNTENRASNIKNILSFDKYSLMKNIDNRFSEIIQAGFERNEITARIEYVDEEPGDICRIETPYDGIKTGVIKNIDISIGRNKITAQITMIERDFIDDGGEM